jgi:hypothetical protein
MSQGDKLSKIASSQTAEVQIQNDTLKLSKNDIDDLRFQLRKKKRRVEELYGGRSLYTLDILELQTARRIITREEETEQTQNQKKAKTIEDIHNHQTSNSILSKLYKKDEDIRNKPLSSAVTRNSSLSVPLSTNTSVKDSKTLINHTLNIQGKDYRMIGNSLMNFDNMLANAAKEEAQRSESLRLKQLQQQPQANKMQQQQEKKQKLYDEIENLLNRKSTHDDEANEEWFSQYDKKIKKLSQQEFMQQRKEVLQMVEVPAFMCKNCEHLITLQYPSLCSNQGHQVVEVTAIKRFFECAVCRKGDYTLTLRGHRSSGIGIPPKLPCRCGNNNWLIRGTSQQVADVKALTGESLVTSGSEWTSKKDALNMAIRVSRLK